ncbi:GNAT family N-acetyltransferase [Candidatus Promineifilum breve]|uniref:GNAT family N-acetyltransferase n=1 Tax=Candidatus Promineifilum breve TaxID=1806508 RepID=UPI00156E95A1|nr:GNAT family protein [Candidatus Promineifilum breve]
MNVELRPFTADDIDQLIAWVPSAEFLLQFAGPRFQFPLTREQLARFLENTVGEEPLHMPFAAIDAATGETIGHIQLLSIDRPNRSLTIGRVLVGPSALRGRGAGGQIMRAALRIAFEEMGMHRVDLGVFDFNAPAIACYERVGFRREGLLRDSRRSGDHYWSLILMSILEDEWRVASGG